MSKVPKSSSILKLFHKPDNKFNSLNADVFKQQMIARFISSSGRHHETYDSKPLIAQCYGYNVTDRYQLDGIIDRIHNIFLNILFRNYRQDIDATVNPRFRTLIQ